MKKKLIVFALIASFVVVSTNVNRLVANSEEEVIVCPGRGERCMKVKIKFLGVCFWKRKAVGGPSLVIVTPE